MHRDYPTRETLRGRLLRDLRAITTLLDDSRTGGQVLERLPSGEYAWLRPEHHPIRIIEPVALPQPDDDTRYDLTELGRRALAEAALFGPWPPVAEASSLDPATCPACHQPQTSPSCATREHWGC